MKSSTARKARIPPQKPTRVLKGHRGPVFTAIFTKDGQYLLSGGDDRTVQLWNPSTGLNIKKYQGHNREVLAIDCLPDNSQFVSCGGDKHATLWDVTTGESIRSFRGHSTRINDIKYSPNVSVLVTGSNDRCVNVWDLRSRNTKPIQTMSEATDSITSLAVLDQEIISGSVDGVLRTYDLRKAKLLEDKADVPITSLKNSGDQRVLLVSFLDSAVRLMDKTSGKLLSTYTGHTNSRFQSRSSYYDGESCVMAGSEDGKVFVWDLLTSRLLWKANGHRGTITSVSSHPRAPCAVSASLDSTICVWESEE